MKTTNENTVRNIIKKVTKREITLNGMMTFGQTESGMHVMDFKCCEDTELEEVVTKCKVQRMRDGNVYISELPRRIKSKPIFREDNSSLSKGRDGRYYFYFSLDEEQLQQLPVELVRQARAIALKVANELNKLYERD